jgi:hypothetical protein
MKGEQSPPASGFLKRYLLTGTLRPPKPPLIIDLRRRQMLVPQELLHLTDISPRTEQQGRCRRPEACAEEA